MIYTTLNERRQESCFTKITSIDLLNIAQNSALINKVYFEDCNLETEAIASVVEKIINNPLISKFYLVNNKGNGADKIAELIEHNKTIVCLTLSSCRFTTQSAIVVFKSLINNECLTELNISTSQSLHRNKISSPAMYSLRDFLKVNKSLVILNLYGNCIGNKGFKILCECFAQGNKTLEEINVGYNLLTKIRFIPPVRKLILSENDFSGETSQKFITSLWLNKTLKNLEMNKCNLIGDSFIALCEGLYKNQTIETISLQDNQITDETPEVIARLFTSYLNNIRNFDASNNRIGDRTARALSKALIKNNLLKELNLKSNCIFDEGASHFLSAIAFNKTLSKFNLRNNNTINYFEMFFEDLLELYKKFLLKRAGLSNKKIHKTEFQSESGRKTVKSTFKQCNIEKKNLTKSLSREKLLLDRIQKNYDSIQSSGTANSITESYKHEYERLEEYNRLISSHLNQMKNSDVEKKVELEMKLKNEQMRIHIEKDCNELLQNELIDKKEIFNMKKKAFNEEQEALSAEMQALLKRQMIAEITYRTMSSQLLTLNAHFSK